LLCRLPFDPIGFTCSLPSVEALGLGEREKTSGFGLGLLVGLDPVRVGGEPILRGDTKTLQRAGFALFAG
jgi:hypothetical protein